MPAAAPSLIAGPAGPDEGTGRGVGSGWGEDDDEPAETRTLTTYPRVPEDEPPKTTPGRAASGARTAAPPVLPPAWIATGAVNAFVTSWPARSCSWAVATDASDVATAQ